MAGTDLELWQDILAGDTKAWEVLVRRYQALVYTIAIRAGLSLDDAADCFQQTWVVLYRHRHKLKDPSRLSAWLVTTAKREAMRLRKLAAKSTNPVEAADRPDSDPLPDDVLIQLERQANLEIAISALNPQCRRVVEAFFFSTEDRTYVQIAESLGVSPNSLGPIRRRCLERLKKILIQNAYWEVRDGGKVAL
jgi:RNA polymerase sigma factor (sigma-70 family)